jgi:alkanesulfonate monooxygenase SsuD/methylene tetrahydromethanopterin reductase-like flavin-dependent oxidoreductase (luciferase family)
LSDISFDLSSLDYNAARRVVSEAGQKEVKGIWLTENSFRDAFVEIAALCQSSERIRFGTMVAGIYSRSPMITALSSLTLSNLSRGRFVLGLGTQTKNTVEYWYGRRFEEPLQQMSEFVQVCRQLLEGSKVSYNGKYQNVKNLQLPSSPYRVKILVAAINAKMIQLAGQVADGVLGTFWTPSYVRKQVVPNLKIGAERGGRQIPDDFEVLCSLDCFPVGDLANMDALRPHLLSLATVPLFAPIFREMGYEREQELIARAVREQDMRRALSLISEEMLQSLELTGNTSDVRTRLHQFRTAGLTEIIISPYVGNVYYEHYPDQFPFDINRYNGQPAYDAEDECLTLICDLR